MIQNIAIVGLNREKAYEVAKLLATELDMHFFDSLELFEFDNIPRTFSQMLKDYGESYYRKKEKGMIGYVSDFTNCVINLESGMAENIENIKQIKETSLLIYIHMPASMIEKKLIRKKYATKEEQEFFNVDINRIKERIKALKKNSDIMVIDEGSELKVSSQTLRKIKEYYKLI